MVCNAPILKSVTGVCVRGRRKVEVNLTISIKKEAEGRTLPIVRFLGYDAGNYEKVSGDIGHRGSIHRSNRVEIESSVDTGLGNTS